MRDIAGSMSAGVVDTHQVSVYMAGDLSTAQRVIREHCYETGARFTVTPTKFIYTGGEEDGFIVGVVNYPRFPKRPHELQCLAEGIAGKLLSACNQRTCLLVGTVTTTWITMEPPGGKPP